MGRYIYRAQSTQATNTPAVRPGDSASARRPPDLTDILPTPAMLTPEQRRLWPNRTANYRAGGMSEPDAQKEAMTELVCTGKLYSWPVESGSSQRSTGTSSKAESMH